MWQFKVKVWQRGGFFKEVESSLSGFGTNEAFLSSLGKCVKTVFSVFTGNTVSAVRLVKCSQEIQLTLHKNTVSPTSAFYAVSDTTLRSINTIIGTD